MIYIHQLNPTAFNLGGYLDVRWYGLMYIVGFAIAWLMGKQSLRENQLITISTFSDLLNLSGLAVLVGGRLGYVLIYKWEAFIADPWLLFQIREGGMSFHGALITGILMCIHFSKNKGIGFFKLTDFIAPLIPPGLFFGRLGNFINAELYGKPTLQDWGVIFPNVDQKLRHPSQLYEMLGEGLLLGLILSLLKYRGSKNRRPGYLTSHFIMHYGWIRFFLEFFREPDWDIGYLSTSLTMGQHLSLLMILATATTYYISTQYSKKTTLKTAHIGS